MRLTNEKIYRAVGDKVTAVWVTGTDFGTQRGPAISNETYSKMYKPFHKHVNDWIHEHTSWKTFIHSCGSVEPLIGEFIEAGFDIWNPVQTSAANMDPQKLKLKYGNKITFWGGGVDTQHILPYSPLARSRLSLPRAASVRRERRVGVFSRH